MAAGHAVIAALLTYALAAVVGACYRSHAALWAGLICSAAVFIGLILPKWWVTGKKPEFWQSLERRRCPACAKAYKAKHED